MPKREIVIVNYVSSVNGGKSSDIDLLERKLNTGWNVLRVDAFGSDGTLIYILEKNVEEE